MESNRDATEWTIRLRQDVTFHNGKTLGAEDVAYTFRRVTDPKFPLLGAPELGPMDRDGIKILDERTLRVPMHSPFSIFDQAVADDINLGIIPVGYDPKKPVGTGPFKFDSFAPGQQSEFLRYEGFWGQPAYIDRLTLIDSFGSDTAVAAAPLTLARLVSSNGSFRLNVSEATQWTPFCMRVDLPPFDNADVREAFRLIVDRDQIIKIALDGYGVVGNDVCARWDGASDAFHRSRDIDRAKALLKKAGHANLTVELTTSDIANGVVQAAQIFARQAMDAGVTVKVRQVMPDVFFGEQFLTWPFAQDFWTLKSYLGQVELCLLPDSQYNETHWRDPAYVNLYKAALATVDPVKRAEVVREMQAVDFERGGYIIPSHNQIVDLVAHNVRGISPGTFFAMGDYDFARLWLS
jgi:peptide/nickel transport system substrate-binding protein